MAQVFDYCVRPDRDGQGWLVAVEGRVAHSLPYDTLEEANTVAGELVRLHPGSTLVVSDQPLPLTPVEIDHRTAA